MLLSLFVPGGGQILLGRYRRGLIWFGAGYLVPLVIASTSLGVIGFLLAVLVRPAAAVDVAFIDQGPAYKTHPVVLGFGILVAAYLASMVVRMFVVEAFKIPAGSMIPTLQVGDHIFVAKWDRWVERGDVIVFRYPRDPNKDFIKRVVAVGGDRIAVRKNWVYVNGQAVQRQPHQGLHQYWDYNEEKGTWGKRASRLFDETLGGHTYVTMEDAVGGYRDYPDSAGGCDFGMLADPKDPDVCIVPPKHLFVMGDNRNNSHDSRFWGPVPLENVKGTAKTIWWSSGSPDGTRWARIGSVIH